VELVEEPPVSDTTINLGNHAVWVTIDPATHTAYTANSPDNTVSVIEARK
jgi:DNA-binding beta-propeller fold protein YncE